jgi:N-acylneuraminate cytidylyltransferase
MSGKTILPVMIDPAYTVDIDTPKDWARYEWLVLQGDLEIVTPGRRRRPIPAVVDLVVFDFDGVLTDNRVWTDQDGREMVASNRSDSLGLERMRKSGIQAMVISKEVNPVVAARCRKLNLECIHGVDQKDVLLSSLLKERGIDPERVMFVGNDLNDLPCFPIVGCAVAVADALPEVLASADLVLTQRGGHGAVRELCDMLIQRKLH